MRISLRKGSEMKRYIRKTAAVVLALIIVLSAVTSAFAQGRTNALYKHGEFISVTEASAGNSTGSDSPAVTATDSDASAVDDAQNSGNENSASNEEALKQKTDLYTVMAIIALGAIIVGIREKKNGR